MSVRFHSLQAAVATVVVAGLNVYCPFDPSPRPLVCEDVADGEELHIEAWRIGEVGLEVGISPHDGELQKDSVKITEPVGVVVADIDAASGVFSFQLADPTLMKGSFRFEATLVDHFGSMCPVVREFVFVIDGSNVKFS
jgi:hypothetical protein